MSCDRNKKVTKQFIIQFVPQLHWSSGDIITLKKDYCPETQPLSAKALKIEVCFYVFLQFLYFFSIIYCNFSILENVY